MTLRYIITLIGFTLGAVFAFADSALAERAPTSLGQDARVRQVAYNPVDVIRVDTHLLVNTAIELGRGERINQVLLGDSESFEVEVLSNRHTVSVKPVVQGAATNMTIYTSRRAIAFALTEGRGRNHTFRVVVDFPDDRPARGQRVAGLGGIRDTGYAFSGDASFRPLRVWNDGRNTFFEFPPDIRPSIFRVNASGREVTTNSSMQGRVVKVAGLHPSYTLRVGDEYLCIARVAGGQTGAEVEVVTLAALEF